MILLTGVLLLYATICHGACDINVTALTTERNLTTSPVLIQLTNIGNTTFNIPYTIQVNTAANATFDAVVSSSTSNSTTLSEAYYQSILPPEGSVTIGLVVDDVPASIGLASQSCPVSVQTQEEIQPIIHPEASLQAATTKDGVIYGVDGQPLQLHGVNWFGFETGSTFVDGLYAGTTQLTNDFATVVYRFQLLGFNAVRLPFSFQDFMKTPVDIVRSCMPTSDDIISSSTSPPGTSPPPLPPPVTSPSARTPGVCNDYVDSSSTMARLVWVTQYLARSGFYVILDNQFNFDTTAVDNTPGWVEAWQQLATAVVADPAVAPYVIFDVLNEPDSGQLDWSTAGSLYLQGLDAIAASTSNQNLMLVQGLGQSGLGLAWGEGYATDPTVLSTCGGCSNPSSFFDQLLTRPYLNQVVTSVHVYPPSISKNTATYQGSALYAQLSGAWGYLNSEGYNGHKFAIMIGETGSDLASALDLSFYPSLLNYINYAGDATDGLHSAVTCWNWWAWNANSGDTKGVVEDDWTTIRW